MSKVIRKFPAEFIGLKVFLDFNLADDEYRVDKDKLFCGKKVIDMIKIHFKEVS